MSVSVALPIIYSNKGAAGSNVGLLRPKAIRMSTGQLADVPWTTANHPEGVRMALGWQAVVPWTSGCPMAIRTPLG